MANWIEGKIITVKHWTNYLFSLTIEAKTSPFLPGQFIKLALPIDGKLVARAYSYLNPVDSEHLEFFITRVENGTLSPLLYHLHQGDRIMLSDQASGFFTLNEVPDCQILWMMGSGTGIAPYLSMLQSGELDRFEKIALVYAARYATDLCYPSLLQHLQQQYPNKLHLQTIVSREHYRGCLYGRIPDLISNGELERSVNLPINKTDCHVMLCGNPDMISATKQLLKEQRQMERHLRRKPGQVSSEQYW